MLVSNNPNISRGALMGFYMFLFSESLRHAQDISDIRDRMKETAKRINLTEEEETDLEREGLKYVKLGGEKVMMEEGRYITVAEP
jgi:hypothetical protein